MKITTCIPLIVGIASASHHHHLKEVKLFPEGAGFDYQLGGAYTPPKGVKIVARDRTESPAKGFYNICYINGF